MSPDRAAKAAALRTTLQAEAPDVVAFLDDMKAGFGARVLWVQTPTVEEGKRPEGGVRPYAPLPDSTWPYEVGKTPGDAYKPRKKRK